MESKNFSLYLVIILFLVVFFVEVTPRDRITNLNSCEGEFNTAIKSTTTIVYQDSTTDFLTDYCIGNVLYEYYCFNKNEMRTQRYFCSGGCLDGVCFESEQRKLEITGRPVGLSAPSSSSGSSQTSSSPSSTSISPSSVQPSQGLQKSTTNGGDGSTGVGSSSTFYRGESRTGTGASVDYSTIYTSPTVQEGINVIGKSGIVTHDEDDEDSSEDESSDGEDDESKRKSRDRGRDRGEGAGNPGSDVAGGDDTLPGASGYSVPIPEGGFIEMDPLSITLCESFSCQGVPSSNTQKQPTQTLTELGITTQVQQTQEFIQIKPQDIDELVDNFYDALGLGELGASSIIKTPIKTFLKEVISKPVESQDLLILKDERETKILFDPKEEKAQSLSIKPGEIEFDIPERAPED